MSKWIVAMAAVALVSGASVASAGEPVGQVPSTQLQALGLSGITPISDAEGHQVRGMGLLDGLLAGLFGGGGGGTTVQNFSSISFDGVNIEGDENVSNFGGSGFQAFGRQTEFGPQAFGGAFGGVFSGSFN